MSARPRRVCSPPGRVRGAFIMVPMHAKNRLGHDGGRVKDLAWVLNVVPTNCRLMTRDLSDQIAIPGAARASQTQDRNIDTGLESFTARRFALILAACIFAAYPDVVLGMRTFFFRDFGYFGYPMAFHHRESFWHGEIPLWNPLNNCGLPFLAQWNTMTLYPGSLFYVLFPLSWSLGVFCLLHQFLAGLGMYFLGRKWTGNRLGASVAGLAFALNGLTLNCLMWPNNIAALGWMPWVVLMTERAWVERGRRIASAALVGAMQMLSGAPEVILLTWGIVGVLALDQSFKELRSRRRSVPPSLSPQTNPSPGLAATLSHPMRYVFSAGSTGDPPVPSGDPPDVTGRGIERKGTDFSQPDIAATAPGGSPGGAGGSPAPPTQNTHPMGAGERSPIASVISCTEVQLPSTTRARMIWLRVFLVVGLVAGISAVQLLPFLDLLAHSDRGAGFADSSWAMPTWGWANLLVPLFNCFTRFFGVYAQYGQYWTSSYYMGVAVLLMALAAVWQVRERRVWILVAMALVSWILALGDRGHIYAWLRNTIPQFGFMRYPVKYVVGSVFCIPLLAAYAMQRLAGASAASAARAWKSAVAMGSLLIVISAGIVWAVWRHPLFPGTWAVTWQSGASRAVLLVLTLGALYLLVRLRVPRQKNIAAVAVLALVALDTLTHMPRQNPVVGRAALEPGLVRLAPQPRHGELRAMISPAAQVQFNAFASTNALTDFLVGRSGLFMNCNLLDNIPKVDGLYSLSLREPERVLRRLLYASTNFDPRLSPLLDFLAVGQFTAPGKPADWQHRPTHLPLATAGQRPVFTSEADTFTAIADVGFDPRRVVYLPPEARAFVSATKPTACEIIHADFGAQRAEIGIHSPAPGILTVAQAHYHWWRADVDGRPVRIWRANYAFQALAVPVGRHTVRLKYDDRLFRAGVIISVLTLAGCLFWLDPPSNRGQFLSA